ncbi:hypothetical protein AB0H73_06320 [Streptomyces olivoreticuli]
MGLSLPGGVEVDDYGRMKVRRTEPPTYWVRFQNKQTGKVATQPRRGTKKEVRDWILFFDLDRGTSGPRMGAEIWLTYKNISKRVAVYAGGVTAPEPEG